MAIDIVTIDFETYYDSEYSLSKMTTEEYVRDPRFEVIGVSVKFNNHSTDWYSGNNVGGFLRSLDYSHRAILAHNAVFDGAILSWHYGIKPKLWIDTLSMAKPYHNITVGGSLKSLADFYRLGTKGTEVIAAMGKRRKDFTYQELEQYGRYCCNDADLTYALFRELVKKFPPVELLVIDQTIRMYTEPTIELDTELLAVHLQEVQDAKQLLMERLDTDSWVDKMHVSRTMRDVLMSNAMLSDYLTELGVTVPVKVSAKGNTIPAFAKTDAEFTALQYHPDPQVQAIVSARLGVKSTIEETRTESLLRVATRGRLPVLLNYFGAHTGRYSGGDGLNLQNLPKRGNTTIRRALCAPEGMVFVACDSSQIEARVVAWLAGQDDLVEAFRNGKDVYSEFASKIYGRPISKADKIERFIGKTCILGLGYGMGAAKLQNTLAIGQGGIQAIVSIDTADAAVRLYREQYAEIAKLWRAAQQVLADMIVGRNGMFRDVLEYDSEGIAMPSGFRIRYPGLTYVEHGEAGYLATASQFRNHIKNRVTGEADPPSLYTKIYGGKVVENIVQGLAAQIIREQMAACVRQKMQVVLQVHDEIVIAAPADQADTYMQKLMHIMSTPPTWAPSLPVACEAGFAENYGDT